MRRSIAIVLLVLVAPHAFAQSSTAWGLFGPHDFKPAIGPADMAVIVRSLQLDEDEQALINALYDFHAKRVLEEGGAVRREAVEIIEETQLSGRTERIEELRELVRKWQKKRRAFDDDFLEELKVILDKEQLERWPIVERELYRMDEIYGGTMAGEGIDLTLLAETEGVEMTEAIEELLLNYAIAIDRALRAREAFFEEHPASEYAELLETDPERAARRFEEMRDSRMAVRDVNLEYVDRLVTAAGPEVGVAIRRSFNKTVASSGIDRQSIPERAIEGALALDDLSNQQRSALKAIEDDYKERHHAWLTEYAKVIVKVEEETRPDPLLDALGEKPIEEEPSPYMENQRDKIPELTRLFEKRLRLDRTIRRSVESVLTLEQENRMPLLIQYLTIRNGDVFGAGSPSWY